MPPLFICILTVIRQSQNYSTLNSINRVNEFPECFEDEITESGGRKQPILFVFLINIWCGFVRVSDFLLFPIFQLTHLLKLSGCTMGKKSRRQKISTLRRKAMSTVCTSRKYFLKTQANTPVKPGMN